MVHATCLVYYLFFLDRQFRGDVAILAILVFLKTMASYNPTSLTPSPFTEVPVLSQESERSCICVLVISNLLISTIFLLTFWNFSDSVIFFFSIYYRLWKKNYDDVPATGPPKRDIARWNNTALGPEDRLKLLSKLWIWVENTKNIMNKSK